MFEYGGEAVRSDLTKRRLNLDGAKEPVSACLAGVGPFDLKINITLTRKS